MQVCKANSGSYLYLPPAMICLALCANVVPEARPRYVSVYNQSCHGKCSNVHAIVPVPGYSQVNERQLSKNAARNAEQIFHRSNHATTAICQYQIYHRPIPMHRYHVIRFHSKIRQPSEIASDSPANRPSCATLLPPLRPDRDCLLVDQD
jgi:hypothetical protein